ncbi:MAG: DegQ family serine endoprotease [Granulosicoccus sp.]
MFSQPETSAEIVVKNGTQTQSAVMSPASRLFTLPRISRKPMLLLVLLPFLAVTTSWADSLPDFSALVQEEGDAVVKISVTTESTVSADSGLPGFDPEQLPEQLRRFFEQMPQNPEPKPRRSAGFGSGFIISEDGYIMTNAHVVNDATDIRVGLHDRRELKAELVGLDKVSDIALLKLDVSGLPTVKFGDSDELSVGEWVLAIGSPFGFEHTATQGIVSALSRSLPDDTYVPFIQTDVAVNPGNSGGPLFNTNGEVVGVNSQIYSRSGGYQGLSFAIPINVAVRIADQLKTQGYATRGWLGVAIQNVDQALAESFGLSKPEGALVAQISKGSPADKGGLVVGDIILAFNNKSVRYSSELPPLVGSVTPGDDVEVELLRAGERQKLTITIEPLETERSAVASSADQLAEPEETSRLGVLVGEITDEVGESMGIDNGVLVTEIDSDGPAAQAGIQVGDVIVSLYRKKTESVDMFEQLVKKLPVGEPISILVQRQSSPLFLALTLPQDG